MAGIILYNNALLSTIKSIRWSSEDGRRSSLLIDPPKLIKSEMGCNSSTQDSPASFQKSTKTFTPKAQNGRITDEVRVEELEEEGTEDEHLKTTKTITTYQDSAEVTQTTTTTRETTTTNTVSSST